MSLQTWNQRTWKSQDKGPKFGAKNSVEKGKLRYQEWTSMKNFLSKSESAITLHINTNFSVSPSCTGYPKKATVDKHIMIPKIIMLLNNGADFLMYLWIMRIYEHVGHHWLHFKALINDERDTNIFTFRFCGRHWKPRLQLPRLPPNQQRYKSEDTEQVEHLRGQFFVEIYHLVQDHLLRKQDKL
jgi:hypothetical protein